MIKQIDSWLVRAGLDKDELTLINTRGLLYAGIFGLLMLSLGLFAMAAFGVEVRL